MRPGSAPVPVSPLVVSTRDGATVPRATGFGIHLEGIPVSKQELRRSLHVERGKGSESPPRERNLRVQVSSGVDYHASVPADAGNQEMRQRSYSSNAISVSSNESGGRDARRYAALGREDTMGLQTNL